MPHALRVYKSLKSFNLPDAHAMAVASVVEEAKSNPAVYDREAIVDRLCDAGLSEPLAESFRDALRNCFASQRFSTHFNVAGLKVNLVRAGLSAADADSFLASISPCVTTPRHAEIRQSVRHQPAPGRVVMCDFTFLMKPEMQKERRAIVVSARSPNATGRCAVVPVSKLPAATPHPHHYQFDGGSYPFFHKSAPVWAVCDHIYTVSLERLWMVNVNHRPMSDAAVTPQHLAAIRNLLGTALGV